MGCLRFIDRQLSFYLRIVIGPTILPSLLWLAL